MLAGHSWACAQPGSCICIALFSDPLLEQGILLPVEFPQGRRCRKGEGDVFWMGPGTLPSTPPQQIPEQ